MNLFVLTFFIAAAATDPATTGTSSSNTNNSSKNSTTTTTTKKNSKSTATIVADPNAPQDTSVALPKSKKTPSTSTPVTADPADPASIVGNSIDAATQIANDAAKAALEEAAKLSAIGSDGDKTSPAGSIINAQTINAASDGAVAVAKEIKKPKVKKAGEDTGSTDEAAPKPAKKPKASNSDGATAPVPADSPATKN